MRAFGLAFFAAVIVASCGGKIDGDIDSGTPSEAGADSPSVCKSQGSACVATAECCLGLACVGGACGTAPPPPKCEPDGAGCTTAAECCSHACSAGFCGPPVPPPCKPDGIPCSSAGECCSETCSGTCGATAPDAGVGCATTSSKKCDQCVAGACCSQEIACDSDPTCSGWLSCVQNCEQQGSSAFACTQTICKAPSTPTESALYQCASQSCFTPCQTD